MTNPKYMRPGLSFAMGKAIEECGELLAAIGKTQRWGWDSYNPEIPRDQRESNEAWVRREIADVRGALDNLERNMDEESMRSMDRRAAEVEQMQAALRPFAEAAEDLADAAGDADHIWESPAAMSVTAGHLRAAKRAFQS